MKYTIIKKDRDSLNKIEIDYIKRYNKILRISISVRLFNLWNQPHKKYYFLYFNKKIIGICSVYLNIISGLVIDPVYQHKKFGSYLLLCVKNDLRSHGYNKIELVCHNSLRSYYEQFGFTEPMQSIKMECEFQ